jgi:hypothetical protein
MDAFPEKFIQFVASDAKVNPIVKEVYAALHVYSKSPARQEWLKQRKRCSKAALENEFFTDVEKKEMRDHGQEPHVVNKLVTGVQGASAIATANRPDIKVFPLRESDPYLSELAKSGLEHVWLKNMGNDVVYDAVEERNIGGIGCIYGYLDQDKGPFGACVFAEEDPEMWYWDENSRKRDRSDTHLIRAQLRSIKYIMDNYPDLDEKKIKAINDEFEEQPSDVVDTKTGEDNYAVGEKDHTPAKNDVKRIVWEIEAYMLRTVREYWAVVIIDPARPFVIRFQDVKTKKDAEKAVEDIRVNGIDPEGGEGGKIPVQSIDLWPRIVKRREMSVIVGDQVIPQDDPATRGEDKLEKLPNPLGVDSDGDPVLPVVFYYAQRTRKAYYRAPTYYAFDANKSLCKRESQYTLAISKNLSAPIVREEQGTKWADSKRPDRPGNELLISKSSRIPQRLQTAAIDLGALTARIVEDKENIDEAYGLPEVLRGKVPQGLERMSGRLGLALQDTGTVMQNPAIRGLESCLERLGKLLLSILLSSWNEHMWRSLVTEERVNTFRPPVDRELNAEPDENKSKELQDKEREERRAKWEHAIAKITREGISVVDFNLAITAGSSLPTNRLLKEETAMEKYKLGLYDRRAALEYSGDPHAKEIAERMDNREMQLAQMGAKVTKG